MLARISSFPAQVSRRPGSDRGLARALSAIPRLVVAVIHGGDKTAAGAVLNQSANTRSWKSYQAVAQDIAGALTRLGVARVLVLPDDMRLAERLRREGVHLAWVNSAGVQGYNPACHTPALLEMLGLPYVGHNPLNASTLDNKHAFKRELVGFGIPTAPFMTWTHARGSLRPEINPRFQRIFGDFAGPFVVKPVTGRASLHVHVVELDRLADTVEEIGQLTDNLVLIEPYLPGREFCVAVAGPVVARGGMLERRDSPFVFSAVERHLQPDEPIFTSMDIKPITRDRWSLASDPAIVADMLRIARDVHLDFNLETLVRLDLRADRDGRLMVLEANPKPDLKRPTEIETSLVCAGLEAHGMAYDDLILGLLGGRIDFLLTHRPGACGVLAELADA